MAALRWFRREIDKLINTGVPDTCIILDNDNPMHITMVINGISFNIEIRNDYPFSSPYVSYINSSNIPVTVNFASEWSPVISLVTIAYTLMLDYVPNIIERPPDSNTEEKNILDEMLFIERPSDSNTEEKNILDEISLIESMNTCM